MTVYLTNKAQPGVQPKYLPDGDNAILCTYAFGTTGLPTLAANDTFTLCTVPAGCYITGITLDVDKLDSGGSPTIKLNLGDGTVSGRFINQSTAAQAGGYQVPNVNGGMGFLYATNTPLILTVQTGASAAVPASANVRVIVNYSADP